MPLEFDTNGSAVFDHYPAYEAPGLNPQIRRRIAQIALRSRRPAPVGDVLGKEPESVLLGAIHIFCSPVARLLPGIQECLLKG